MYYDVAISLVIIYYLFLLFLFLSHIVFYVNCVLFNIIGKYLEYSNSALDFQSFMHIYVIDY